MKLILAGNWKNYPESPEEAINLLSALARRAKIFKKLSTFIIPPAVYLGSAAKKIKSFAYLGSQDVFFSGDSTVTGAVTADMLRNLGAKAVIIGHSERRRLGETNQVVSEKVKTALKSGLIPIVCVGEEVHDSEGNYFELLNEQIRSSLEGVRRKDDAHKIIVAYEPVWAIGRRAKEAMQPTELSQMVIYIKKVLTEVFGRDSAGRMPILYGGSVEPSNAKDLVTSTGIKGFLVGHASLEAKSFGEIAQALLK